MSEVAAEGRLSPEHPSSLAGGSCLVWESQRARCLSLSGPPVGVEARLGALAAVSAAGTTIPGIVSREGKSQGTGSLLLPQMSPTGQFDFSGFSPSEVLSDFTGVSSGPDGGLVLGWCPGMAGWVCPSPGIVKAACIRRSLPASEHGAGAVGSRLPGSWVLPGELSVGEAFPTSLTVPGEELAGRGVSCSLTCIRATAAGLGLRSASSGGLERPFVFLHRRAGRGWDEAARASPGSSSFPEAAIRDVLADLRGSGTVPMELQGGKPQALP